MKKNLISLFLCVAAITVWGFVLTRNDKPSMVGELIPVPESESGEIIKVVNEAIKIYNTKDEKHLRAIFFGGNVPDKVWKLMNVKDPVSQSIETISACGRKLELKSPEILRHNTSARQNYSYVVTGTVNEYGDRLKFKISKRKKYYYIVKITKI